MRILGFDPFLSSDRIQELGIDAASTVADMLPRVDYLTVHTPLTDETRNLVGQAQLEQLKPGVRLINCARGGIYDEAALLAGLNSGRIAGVALDVFASEPCTNSPLFGLPGVLATPHLGASTEEAQAQVAVEGVGLLLDYLTRGAIRHAVNMMALDAQTLADVRAYLDLGYRLGLFMVQWDRDPIKRCKLHYRGEVANKNTKLITASFAAGLLAHALVEEANIVNSEVLLRERGIELVEETRGDMGTFSSLVLAEVSTDSKTYRAAGTVFGVDMLRLVQLNDYRLDSYLDGVLLVFTHRDVPGIIGIVGTIFGRHKVNIGQMTVGRTTKGGEAIGVLNLDQVPPGDALDEVRDHPAIQSVSVIKLPAANDRPAWMTG
jgi:D-3-phosphoglycerate dehydrogenase